MATEGAKEQKYLAVLFTLYCFCSAARAGRSHVSGTIPVKRFNPLVTNQEQGNDNNSNQWPNDLCNRHDLPACVYSTCK